MKYSQAWTRMSSFSSRAGCCSCRMYDSCWSSMKSTIGAQLSRLLT